MTKFRIFDAISKRILTDCSGIDASINWVGGIGYLNLNTLNLIPLLFTGEKAMDGKEIYDGDIVEAMVKTNRGEESVTDHVHFHDSAWRFGNFDGTLSDVVLIAVRGNVYETPWPVGRPIG